MIEAGQSCTVTYTDGHELMGLLVGRSWHSLEVIDGLGNYREIPTINVRHLSDDNTRTWVRIVGDDDDDDNGGDDEPTDPQPVLPDSEEDAA